LGREIVLVDEAGASEATVTMPQPSKVWANPHLIYSFQELLIGFCHVQLDLVRCPLFDALVMLNESKLSN
jgi:hypothetical protein